MAERIGILGGSFNPIHLGHLIIAERISDILSLSKVLLVPNFVNPHKAATELASPEHRLEMIRIAVRELPKDLGIDVSTYELDKREACYTIDTLRHFVKEGFEPIFIMGADSFLHFPGWKEYRAFFDVASIVVVSRPTMTDVELKELIPITIRPQFEKVESQHKLMVTYRHRSGNHLWFVSLEPISISSSGIRRSVAQGQDIGRLLPPGVAQYIYEKKLYVEA